MARRGIRVLLWAVVVLAAAATAYLFWIDEAALGREERAARAFAESADAAARAVMDVRAAQQAYVATGQGDEFWASKTAAALAIATQALGTMRGAAASPAAQSAVQSASATLQDFEQMDRRAREYTRSGQHLLASDIIFSDGLEMTESAWSDIQRARADEQRAADAAARAVRQRQWLTLAAGAATVCLLTLLLVPVPRPRTDTVAAETPQPAVVPRSIDDIDFRRALEPRIEPTPPPAVDLGAVASLCTELARVTDTRSLPSILERASGLLDASGIVLWIADPDGRELAPILAHGYSPQLVNRLGTIPRDAENVTAAAFRTGLVQTVKGDAFSNGAIAAPLVTPGGCVAVMAAEMRNGGEQQEARLAAATIVAAQLATLVGPPVARGSKAEVASS